MTEPTRAVRGRAETAPGRPCRICGLEPGTRHGRCNTCRSYHRQHPGTERPYELIRQQLQREATRRL